MNKRGNAVVYIILAFIAVLLFSLLAVFISTESRDLITTTNHTSDETFIATRTENETLSPVGEGITSIMSKRQNDTWLSLNGTTDYLFIPDNNYSTVTMWVNDSSNEWLFIVNSSTGKYEDNVSVVSFTLNPFKRNTTGWYFGMNSSGFFEGNIDSIKFYNDTVSTAQISQLYVNGR